MTEMDYSSFNFDQFGAAATQSAPQQPQIAAELPVLAALLLQQGALAPEAAQQAVDHHRATGEPLVKVLLTGGLCSVDQIAAALALRPQYG